METHVWVTTLIAVGALVYPIYRDRKQDWRGEMNSGFQRIEARVAAAEAQQKEASQKLEALSGVPETLRRFGDHHVSHFDDIAEMQVAQASLTQQVNNHNRRFDDIKEVCDITSADVKDILKKLK